MLTSSLAFTYRLGASLSIAGRYHRGASSRMPVGKERGSVSRCRRLVVAARRHAPSVQNLPMDPGLLPMYEQLTTALNTFVRGDAEPYKLLWAHTEDVSVLGAFGG